jgi:hypothetical protein
MTALQIIEEVYEIALNPTQPYFAQLEPLAPNGELANRTSANRVLFKLCELVDHQAKQIKALEEDRVDIANKMLELQNTLSHSSGGGGGTADIVNSGSTQPIDEPSSDPTKPIADSAV